MAIYINDEDSLNTASHPSTSPLCQVGTFPRQERHGFTHFKTTMGEDHCSADGVPSINTSSTSVDSMPVPTTPVAVGEVCLRLVYPLCRNASTVSSSALKHDSARRCPV